MNRIVSLIEGVAELAERIGSALSFVPPTLARIVVGWIFLTSGWGKLHNLANVTQYFTDRGLPMPAFQAVFASSNELICGGLLLLGLATRFAVVPLIITMIVALNTALRDQIQSVSSLYGLAEFLYICLLVWLGTNGAGPISIDALLSRVAARPQEDRGSFLERSTARALV
ncbi:MAG: DoxX family protein [Deltaproteobacteria bacterium]|nr:DoxX family protein [Deltaproteobacteria bacterium]